MRELLVFGHEVELLDDGRVVGEAIFANLEEHLDHVLHARLHRLRVQDVAQPLEHT